MSLHRGVSSSFRAGVSPSHSEWNILNGHLRKKIIYHMVTGSHKTNCCLAFCYRKTSEYPFYLFIFYHGYKPFSYISLVTCLLTRVRDGSSLINCRLTKSCEIRRDLFFKKGIENICIITSKTILRELEIRSKVF